MRVSSRFRASLSGACFALGGVWAAAGAMRLLFGVAVTFPLLPPVDLGRVGVGSALAVALGFFLAGAWLERGARAAGAAEARAQSFESTDEATRPPALAGPSPNWPPPDARAGRATVARTSLPDTRRERPPA